MPTRTFAPPAQFHLGRSTFAYKSAHLLSHGRQIVWATRTPEGAGTLEVSLGDAAKVRAEAWGPGADWMLEQAPRLVGCDDDPSGFAPHHDVVAKLMRDRGIGFRIGRTDRVLESVVAAVLGQKVHAALAKESLRKLRWKHGARAPGPHKEWLLPTDEQIAKLPYHDWHALNVERKRARIIRYAASRANRLEEICTMSTVDADRRLQAFEGIGPWTSAQVRITALGDPDAVMVGDLHLKNTVCWALAGEARGTDERMMELLEPYAGHRGRVPLLLKMGGITAPRYGPRLSHRRIESH